MTSLRTYALVAAGIAGLAAILTAGSTEAVDILPNETLQGWTRIPIPAISGLNPKLQWRVDTAQQALICTGEGGHEWLRYDRELGDFELQVDWRFTARAEGEKRYNSGIGVRMSRYGEVWHQAQTGTTGAYLFGETLTDGMFRRFNLSKDVKENRVKAVGEWNHFDLRAQADRITLAVNGAMVNELSGVGFRRGYIGLEAEGYEIAFRNLRLKVLE